VVKVNHRSAVGIATGYRRDDRRVGVRVPVNSRILTSPYHPDRLWGPPNLLPNGYRWALSPGLRQQGVKLITLQISAEVKKTWIYTSTSPHALMAVCLFS
jgi:hypothetical protein